MRVSQGPRAPVALVACALLGGLAAGAAEDVRLTGDNLLLNPGFEQIDAAGDFAEGWQGFSTPDWGDCRGTAKMSGEPRGGERCVEVSGVILRYAVAAQRIAVDPEKAYVLRGWVRTDLRGAEVAYLAASWSSEERWLRLEQTTPVRGVRPWQQMELLLLPETRGETATRLQVSCRVESSTAAGRAWFDDLALHECEPPLPEPRVQAEQRRYRNLARELLIQQAFWGERTEALRRRRRDMEELLALRGATFEQLRVKYGRAVREGRFLSRRPRTLAEIEAEVLAKGADVRQRLDELRAEPDPRDAAFAELEAGLRLKRQIAGDPELRRFHLWAQLHALRPKALGPRHAGPAPRVPPSYARLEGGELSQEGLIAPVARPELDLATDRGVVDIEVELYAAVADRRLQAALHAADGRVVAFGEATTAADAPMRLRLELAAPHYWLPDCPYTYDLVLALWGGDELEDTWRGKVAFRQIRIVESDVTATMRHAWGLPPADYTMAINGQPFFPTGTVCREGSGADVPRQTADLFEELWLDFQRTYGSAARTLDGELGRAFEERGLCFAASLRPSYAGIRQYRTAADGFEDYREQLRTARAALHHPSLLTIEIGNEAELSVWGANLPTYYAEDLWHCFDEAARCVREELAPAVPVGYVRVAHHRRVAPVPREDYSGINQYTGRYWGRMSTMAPDLAALSHVAEREAKPFGVTEWNGPKYSWATSGVGGVTERGAAHYIYRYFDTLIRTPMTMLSTEFVLNWVVMPLEDLTTVPIEEGLAWREQFRWSKQKGCDWYPHIWPPGPADTPPRRAMRGFQSPLFFLRLAPGPVVIAHVPERHAEAEKLVAALAALGKQATGQQLGADDDLSTLDANALVLGGCGNDQPEAVRRLERLGVIGVTDATFPRAGGFSIQERVNPDFPDRYLVVVTAADETGMQAAAAKLLRSTEALEEAVARDASCRRVVALVDESPDVYTTFARYVLELPARGVFRGGDDIRTSLSADEFLTADGGRRPKHADLTALILAQSRPLTDEEFEVVRKLVAQGANVAVSLAAYQADERLQDLLGVEIGAAHELTEDVPVEQWAQKPLKVPQLGRVRAETVSIFAKVEPGSARWEQAMAIRELSGEGWEAAARVAGRPVVVRKTAGPGNWWLFGGDIARIAQLHRSVTSRGKIHSHYDRDTACGLERFSRLVINACAFGLEGRPATRPQLRCTVEASKHAFDFGDTIELKIRVADLAGQPVTGAYVGVGLAYDGRFSLGTVPRRFAPAREVGNGGTFGYRLSFPLRRDGLDAEVHLPAALPAAGYAGQRLLNIHIDARRPGCIPDTTATTVRVGPESDWDDRVAGLKRLIEGNLVLYRHEVNDQERFVELQADLLIPVEAETGKPCPIEVTVNRIERDDGNDWLEDFTLVIRPVDGGEEVAIPLAAGRVLTGSGAPVVSQKPDEVVLVTSASPARLTATWTPPEPGEYALLLRYVYSDQYHIDVTDRVPCEDDLAGLTLVAVE